MRVAPFPPSSSRAACGLAAILALWLAGMAAANAHEIAASAVCGFTEPKIDGMTLTATLVSSGAPVGADFIAKTSTDAVSDTSPTGVAHDCGLDALRSFVTGTVPLRAVESFIGSPGPDRSPSAGEWILHQLDATAPDVTGGFNLAAPQSTTFLLGRFFARRGGDATPDPDAYPVSRSKSERVPSGWAANGNQVPAAALSSPMGPSGTPSIDLVAEAVLYGEGIAKLASGAEDQAVNGSFRIGGAADIRVAVSLEVNLVERLLVCSGNPETDIATVSSAFALDIGDATGRSVFGPFLGANPSVTRMLSRATAGP